MNMNAKPIVVWKSGHNASEITAREWTIKTDANGQQTATKLTMVSSGFGETTKPAVGTKPSCMAA